MGVTARTILIGDVHGCLEELHDLLAILDPRRGDRIIMLGDLINRGPDSPGVVKFVHESGFECLRGNHEDDYLRHPDREPYLKLRQQIGEQAHDWIGALPLWIEEENFLAVHAGLQPGRHPSDTEPRILLNIRTWDGTGQKLKEPNNPPWYDFYQGTRPVFYGHWAQAGLTIRENTLGLDSGCVYGRKLSAYILEEGRVVQVPARARHYIPPALRREDGAAPPDIRS